jgi:hypothetical protein
MLEQCKEPEQLPGCWRAVGVTAGPTMRVTEGNWSWRVTVYKTPKSAFMTPALQTVIPPLNKDIRGS